MSIDLEEGSEIIDGSDEFAGTGYDADTSVEHKKSPFKTRVPESYETAYYEITHELAAEKRKNLMLSSKNDKLELENSKLESENSELKKTIEELEFALKNLTDQVTKGAYTLPKKKGGTLKRRKKRVSTRKK